MRIISIFVFFISVWNYFGRVFVGFGFEVLLIKYKVSRFFIMFFVLFLLSFGDFLIAFSFFSLVYFVLLFIGFFFGV